VELKTILGQANTNKLFDAKLSYRLRMSAI